MCEYEVSILKTKDLAKLDQIGPNWAKLDQVIGQKLTHTINLAISDLKLLHDFQSYSFCVNMKFVTWKVKIWPIWANFGPKPGLFVGAKTQKVFY